MSAVVEPLSDYQNRLVERHVGLAQHIAIAFWKRVPTLDREEILAIGYQGLLTAAQRFDPEYRPADDPNYDPFLAFGPFARTRITGAIQDWMRMLDHVPRRQRKVYKEIQQLGPGRTAEDTADLLGLEVERVRAIICAVESPPISLNALEDAKDREAPRSEHDTAESVLVQSVQDAVAEAVEELPDFEKSVIVLRYYMGLDFVRIASELGTGVTRVKEAHQEAVLIIHDVMVRAASL